MQRLGTRRAWEDAGLSPLARAGSRWLSFARALSRGRGRSLPASDPLDFIERVYGAKFGSVEGAARSLDRVYRMNGGRPFVSETRLSLSVHPRFDLLLNVTGGRAEPHTLREAREATTVLNLFTRAGDPGRARQADAPQAARVGTAAAPSVNIRNVLTTGAARHTPAFGYVNVGGRRARQSRELVPVRVERPSLESATTDTGSATPQTHDAPPRALIRLTRIDNISQTSLVTAPTLSSTVVRPTTLDLRQSFIRAPRQEFVNLLLRSYLASAPGGVLSARPKGELSGAAPRSAAAPVVIHVTRHARGVSEARTEFRSAEIQRETAHAPLLNLLPLASLLSGLPGTSPTLPAAYETQLHFTFTRAAQSFARAGAEAHTTRAFAPTQTGTREVLSTIRTFVGRGRTFVGRGRTTAPRAGHARAFARSDSNEAGAARVDTHSLLTRSVEFVRPLVVAQFMREAAAPRGSHEGANVSRARGARTFLFAAGPHTRREPGALSRTAATAVRLTRAAGAEPQPGEARAARPEGMALELIRHRREQVLELPRPGYVFTQPARAQVEERQVITKASREEIVEVVRREVRALAPPAQVPAAASRAELAGIADEVYSTLVRRLLVEKERLGRF